MKVFTVVLFICISYIKGFGQLYDAQWVLGDYVSVIDFRTTDTVFADTLRNVAPSLYTAASICDENGDLLYFTNGINITDYNGNLVQNGDSLSPCVFTDEEASVGLPISQAALFIPKPGSNEYYYLFHYSYDTFDNSRPGKIYYSIINKAGNGGLGAVVEKNVPIIQKVILRGGGMTACKHANGRDYWLVMGASVLNKFYKWLITPDSISGPFTQSIGPEYPLPYDNAYSKFSQDGSKYATGTLDGRITVMDFDRCSGEFSNPQIIFNANYTDSVPDTSSGCVGLEFSPSGRFLYVSNVITLNQYDLLSDNIQDSVLIYWPNDTDAALVDYLQLGPNGKLYGCTWNGGFYFYHVVNYPDEKGDSCGFVWGGQPTLSLNSDNLPNLINYRLGPLIGSGCDTIASIQRTEIGKQEIRILPNPANKYLYVEMGMQGDYEFQLLNNLGQLIATKQTRQVDIFDTEGLASGVYILRVLDKSNSNHLLVRKVVVEH